jgi:cell wall-associated NlpC family hydrolase
VGSSSACHTGKPRPAVRLARAGLVRATLAAAVLALAGVLAPLPHVPIADAAAASIPPNWTTEAQRVVADAQQHLGQGPYGYADGGWYVPLSGATLPGSDRSGSPPTPDQEPPQLMRAAGTYLPDGVASGIDCVGFMYVVFTETGHGNYAGDNKIVSRRMDAPAWYAYFAANATNGSAPTLQNVDFDTSVDNAALPSVLSDEDLEPGDIIFFKDDDGQPADPTLPSQIFHVAIYEGPYARHAVGQAAADPWVIGATLAENSIAEGDLNYGLVDPNGGFGVLAAVVHLHLDEVAPLSNTIPPAPYKAWSGSDVTPVFDPSTRSTYVPLDRPVRILDTRLGLGSVSPVQADAPRTFQVTGGAIPATAVAITGSVTVADDPGGGALYMGAVPMAKPADAPRTSVVNFAPGRTVTNGLTMGLGSAGNGVAGGRTLSATYMGPFGATVDLIVDVTGYFVADASGGTYHPLAATRVLDTRDTTSACRTCDGQHGSVAANRAYPVAVAGFAGVPENATAITGNLNVVNATGGWALYLGPHVGSSAASAPDPTDPTTAVTVSPGATSSAGVTVGLKDGSLTAVLVGAGGETADLVLDVTGYFTDDSSGAIYVPVVPKRLVDTELTGGEPATLGVTGDTVPDGAVAITGDAVADRPTAGGSLALGPAVSRSSGPFTLAAGEGEVRANQVTTAITTGGTLAAELRADVPATAHFVLDVSGYFAAAPAYDSTTFHPVTPARVLDTSAGSEGCPGRTPGKLSAGMPTVVRIAGCAGVPSEATAITGSVTVSNASARGFLSVGPDSSTTPTTSTVDFSPGQVVTGEVTVALESGSVFAVYTAPPGAALDLALDVTGYFAPDRSGLTYHPVAPVRIVDSSAGARLGLASSLLAGLPATFQVAGAASIPRDATAVTGNVTVTRASADGSLYLGPPYLSEPVATMVSVAAGRVVAGGVTVALSPSGALWATYLSGDGATADIVFDVTGYFTADASGSYFVPVNPTRIVDSRTGAGTAQGALVSGKAVHVEVAGRAGVPASASAIVANVTVVRPADPGWLYVGPEQTPDPGLPAFGFDGDVTMAAGMTAELTSGTLQIGYTTSVRRSQGTDVVLDASGYYVAGRPPGSVAHFVVTAVPATIVAGSPVTVTVEAVDATGHGVTSYEGRVSFSVPGHPEAVLPSGYRFSSGPGGDNGSHTFTLTLLGADLVNIVVTDAANPDVTGRATYVTVEPGPLDHLSLMPVVATVAPGTAQAYRALGYDRYGNLIGDVTADAAFRIDGIACRGATCSSEAPGPHTVTAAIGGATGTATFWVAGVAVPSPSPEVSPTLEPQLGQSPA